MSTRSLIFMSDASDTFYGIYCHWDGYPAHNGWILNNLINTVDDVASLIELGNISSIKIDAEKNDNGDILYRASIDEENAYKEDFYMYQSKTDMLNRFKESWCDYLYYFDDSDETWYVMKNTFNEDDTPQEKDFVRLDSYQETNLDALIVD